MNLVSGRLIKIALALVLGSNLCLASAAAELSESSFVDGTNFLQKLITEYSQWNDYSCVTELHNYKSSKATITKSKFFYKKGPRVRIEIMGGGFRDGSVIIRSPQEKISGKGGFWMGGVRMKFDHDSRMLILPDGTNATRADFPELFALLKENLSHGYSCKVSAEPVDEKEFNRKVFVFEIFDSEKMLSAKIYFAADDLLPIRWDSFHSDKLKASTWFRNLRVNPGLKDDLFQLR
ncbi:MAG: hypothetical protein K2X81_27170 [Candidatus Obscuribacterales bacterium]|nr:hypothetical protein [Candidatus Obscuribacterales bacterium]